MTVAVVMVLCSLCWIIGVIMPITKQAVSIRTVISLKGKEKEGLHRGGISFRLDQSLFVMLDDLHYSAKHNPGCKYTNSCVSLKRKEGQV